MPSKSIPTNIAMAMKCATKIQQGKSCSMAEMRATIMLLKQGLTSSRSAVKLAKNQLKKAETMVERLLGR
tara:strand:- start:642 stop:851 length:210 start_codon:yes stop_codon:yes gene_type:complete